MSLTEIGKSKPEILSVDQVLHVKKLLKYLAAV